MKIIPGGISADDRGYVMFYNDFDPQTLGIRRTYIVKNNDVCDTRAWHGHMHESKYCTVIKGSAVFCTIPLIKNDFGARLDKLAAPTRNVLSEHNPQVLCVPPGVANGFRTLEHGTIIQFYSNFTVEQSKNDDYRIPLTQDFNPFEIVVR